MNYSDFKASIERCPIIAATFDSAFEEALSAPVEVITLFNADLLTVEERISAAHKAGKAVLVHIDLASGIAKDHSGIEYLKKCEADGIISTNSRLIKMAREAGLITVQRFFAIDSKGLGSVTDLVGNAKPDMIEIIPGVISKVIKRFSCGSVPVIAGGLIETKAEITAALSAGAAAITTSKKELWFI